MANSLGNLKVIIQIIAAMQRSAESYGTCHHSEKAGKPELSGCVI